MPSRKQLLVLSLVVVVVVVAAVVLVVGASTDVRVTASSGSDPSSLLENAADAGRADADRETVWRADGETEGAWVELAYPEPTTVDLVRLLGPGGDVPGPTSALLTFDGGSSLLVTTDESGDAVVAFPERTVSRVRVTVAGVPDGADSVALAGLSVDGSADDPPQHGDSETVAGAASSNGDAPLEALTDGDVAGGDTGEEWTAADDDEAPWAALSWNSPREVASVQVFGPTSAETSLRGVLRFDDGSTVRVSAIAPGDDEPTTIAFAPRLAVAVRLELERPDPEAPVGLRGLAVYDAGTTPPRWPQDGETYSVAPEVESCDAASEPVAEPEEGRLTLVCPTPGAAVDGTATVVVAADPGTPVEALAWTGVSGIGTNAVGVAATATADEDGRAVLSVDTSQAPHGPLALKVQETTDDPGNPLYVQLVNRGGRVLGAAGAAPEGMTLQWAEEFTGPLSASATGIEADYSAIKPDASSSGQFGDAQFADPAGGNGTLAVVDGEWLRIRTQPAGPRSARDGTENVAGILASTDAGGAGFAAQYGYFEARMLGAPGLGSWPAFWMLNTESAAVRGERSAEVDAVELYGHDPLGSCHTVHDWGAEEVTGPSTGAPSCTSPNGFTDWAMAWHTYGVRIAPDGATFSIDGQVVAGADRLGLTAQPFFFLVDLALGGGWPVDLAPTGGLTDLYVDWVRVWT
ncbi:family 16 glycosylhydrolase [Geodermatophilus sp. SYSU D01180]